MSDEMITAEYQEERMQRESNGFLDPGTVRIRALKPSEIQCRAQVVKEKGFSILLYKDARCDMNILDEVFGPDRWKKEYELIGNSLFCTVSINFDGEWISKQDVGSESNTEAEKGQASDAFKRACFNWGIGRELYTSPFIWITAKQGEVYKNEKGKWALKRGVSLSVSKITTENGIITSLEIVDRNGVTRFKMGATEKEWLGEGHAHFDAITNKLKAGKIGMEDIESHYKLSEITREFFESIYAENQKQIDKKAS